MDCFDYFEYLKNRKFEKFPKATIDIRLLWESRIKNNGYL